MTNLSDAGLCELCREPIFENDPISEIMFNGRAVHFECGLRSVIGGANHQRRLCSCYGGNEPPDPPGLTERDAARAALRAFQSLRIKGI